MKTLISIDPGVSTGVIIGTYSDTEPFRVTHHFQIPGGVEGFLDHSWTDDASIQFQSGPVYDKSSSEVIYLAEKFSARPSTQMNRSYKTHDLEPLRVEGAILALGIDPQWVSPAQQYFMGGKTLAEKLKARNAWLKEHKELGYYLTGKSVGQKDADDARSALSHCISWLRRNNHPGTLALFRKDEDESN